MDEMPNNSSRDLSSPFDMFGGFGDSIFRTNPFGDPFFSRPFGDMFGRGNTAGESQPAIPPAGPIITQLDSDDDIGHDMEVEGDEVQNAARCPSEPFVDHPDDETSDNEKETSYRTDNNRTGGAQTQSFKVHTCRVAYGGVDGVYYSSSATRKVGSDGVIMEECKEADKSKGEATHRISRGLHDKEFQHLHEDHLVLEGHSVTRKLNSDGKVDSLQTLHNLNEDELGSFEEAWRSNSGNNLRHWAGSGGSGMERTSACGKSLVPSVSHMGKSLVPSVSHMGEAYNASHNNRTGTVHPGARTRKVVRIPID